MAKCRRAGVKDGEDVAAFRPGAQSPARVRGLSADACLRSAKGKTTRVFEGYPSGAALRAASARIFPAHSWNRRDRTGWFHTIPKADGRITDGELDYLRSVTDIVLCFSESSSVATASCPAGHGAPDGRPNPLIFGGWRGDRLLIRLDEDFLKSRFTCRQFASQNHPDMLIARGRDRQRCRRRGRREDGVIKCAPTIHLGARGLEPAAA